MSKNEISKSRLASIRLVEKGKTKEQHANAAKAYVSLIENGYISGDTYAAERSRAWQRRNPDRDPQFLAVSNMQVTDKGLAVLSEARSSGYGQRDACKRHILQLISDYGKPMPVNQICKKSTSLYWGIDREPWATALFELSGLDQFYRNDLELPPREAIEAIRLAGHATIEMRAVPRLMPGPQFIEAGKSLGLELLYWEPVWVSVPGHPRKIMIDDVWCPELREQALQTLTDS